MSRTLKPYVLVLLASVACWALPAYSAAPELKLKRVMLSLGGVGYFEYETALDGDATLGLDVPLDEVDDVLKSLVVFDSAGGVGSIELPGKDESVAAFGDIGLDASAFSSAPAYLNGLQGIEIAVIGPHDMTGRILKAETVATEAPNHNGDAAGSVTRTRVSLITNQGLQQFILEEADSVQVTDPKLRAGIGRALEELHRAAAHDKRHLTLHVGGSQHRIVRVGYVVGAPLWKTTYRLVLPGQQSSAALQAWAVLENQSGVDWDNVELTLQSGNPVTFRQALYQSYFVNRPEVPVDVFDRLQPALDTGSVRMALTAKAFDFRSAPQPMPAPPMPAPPMPAPMAASAGMPEPDAMAPVSQAAQTSEASEALLFRLPKPVTLASGDSASVPLVDHQAKAESVDLAEPEATHPLASVKLTNDTGSGLPPGILTLYAPGAAAFFAGDARIGALPAGETRLLSFAQDLKVRLLWHDPEEHDLVSLTAAKGVLTVATRHRTERRVTVSGPATIGDGARTLLLSFPKSPDSELDLADGAQPGVEETNTAWRVPTPIEAGKSHDVVVRITAHTSRAIALTPQDADQLVALADAEGLTPSEKQALDHVKSLQQSVADAKRHRQDVDASAKRLADDEQRIRQNLISVPATDPLHGRFTKQLEATEDQLASLRETGEQAADAINKAEATLATAIGGLSF